VRVTDLKDLLVVELCDEISGPYVGRMFADMGASVVKLGPATDGATLTGATAQATPLDDFLNAGKVRLRRDAPEVPQLLARADVVIESAPDLIEDLTGLRRANPGVVVVSFTPFGRAQSGPQARNNDFIAQASGGSIAFHGAAGREPFQAGGRITEWAAGTFAAAGALGAYYGRLRTGLGEHIDCSLQAVATFSLTSYIDTRYGSLGYPPKPGSHPGIIEVPSVEPSSDGWVGFNTNTRQQFDDFATMIGRPDVSMDENWPRADYRLAHSEEWNDIVHAWTKLHTTAEIVELAALLRIPVAPVHDAAGVLGEPHFAARGIFAEDPHDERRRAPVPPYVIDGRRVARTDQAPTFVTDRAGSADSAEPSGPADAVRIDDDAAGTRPLTGLRVLDATAFWAGPAVGQLLGFLGAEVIHLESIQRPDGSRNWVGPLIERPQWWERGSLWLSTNSNKKGVTLDLSTPRGLELLSRLIEQSDVLLENFAPRVFDRFGLTFDAVREINPRLIFARMPAFGLSGPWRDRVGFAQTMEQATGMAWVTGHESDQPRIPRGPCDPIAGYHTAFAVVSALVRRRSAGTGRGIEVAMVETALNVAAEPVLELTARGQHLGRIGNRARNASPQGLYLCADDEWVALSVGDAADWAGLCEILGPDIRLRGLDLSTLASRRENCELIDGVVAVWAAARTAAEAAECLMDHAVPASLLNDPRTIHENEELRRFGYFEDVQHPIVGPISLPTIPFRFESIPSWISSPPPVLGQHNDEVLGGTLGLSPAQIAGLVDQRIVGTTPAGL
jgi:crotonobetainyl-CoA:carnitine CoA-transferase CaiB-like acyl-CoA transferase